MEDKEKLQMAMNQIRINTIVMTEQNKTVKILKHELSIANDKLKRIKELIKTNVKDDWSIVETCLVWEIEKIIKGDD